MEGRSDGRALLCNSCTRAYPCASRAMCRGYRSMPAKRLLRRAKKAPFCRLAAGMTRSAVPVRLLG
eukprot:2946499-Lingulodinium_polyedra.AAC.1